MDMHFEPFILHEKGLSCAHCHDRSVEMDEMA
jgi:hypothetical protein